jgi:hypothetical protein
MPLVFAHTDTGPPIVQTGVGLTVMVKVLVGPEQVTAPPKYFGVTVMVAVTGVIPLLTAANAAMGPVPLAASPMLVVSLTQSYEVPVPEKLTAAVIAPLQTVWLAG